MSFDMFAYRELRDTVSDCEDRCDQIEKELLDEKYAESCRKNSRSIFVLQLNEFVLGLEDRLMRFSDPEIQGHDKERTSVDGDVLLPLSGYSAAGAYAGCHGLHG